MNSFTFRVNIQNKKRQSVFRLPFLIGGRWRIRTAVDGFADRCLATRPTDRF